MKKNVFLIFAFLFLASCSNEEIVINDSSLQINSCDKISEEQAIAIANSFKAAFSSLSRTNFTISEVVPISTNSSRSSVDTLIYAVNYNNNDGFVLVSAKKSVEPIIGYVEKGSFNAGEANENENFQFYLELAKEYVNNNSTDITPVPVPIPSYEITLTIPNKLDVSWGQRYPEGVFCPNGIAGCVQISALHILSYLEKPNYINLSYPNCGDSHLELDWKDIKKHKSSLKSDSELLINLHLSTCESSQTSHIAIGKLCREIGFRSFADYQSSGTYTFVGDIVNTLKGLIPEDCISRITYLTNYESFLEDLKSNNCVSYIEGYDDNNNGHAWNCDGAKKITTYHELELIDGSKEIEERSTIYFHFVWGVRGSYDGYFHAGVFDPTKSKNFNSKKSRRSSYHNKVKYFIVSKK